MNDDFVDLAARAETRDLAGAMGFRQVIYHPHYGPFGRPYTVVARRQGLLLQDGFWTSREAMDRRDELLDKEYEQVIVLGLPTVISGSTVSPSASRKDQPPV